MNVVKMVHTFNTAATPRTCKRKVFPAAPGFMTTHARVVKVSGFFMQGSMIIHDRPWFGPF
jgi:hypothetical protein